MSAPPQTSGRASLWVLPLQRREQLEGVLDGAFPELDSKDVEILWTGRASARMQVQQMLASKQGHYSSVVLVGGDADLPHVRLPTLDPNDVAIEVAPGLRERFPIASDEPWGWTYPRLWASESSSFPDPALPLDVQVWSAIESVLADVPVIRVPILDPSQLRRLLAQRPHLDSGFGSFIALSQETWAGATAKVVEQLKAPSDSLFVVSSSYDETRLSQMLASNYPKKLLLNLHSDPLGHRLAAEIWDFELDIVRLVVTRRRRLRQTVLRSDDASPHESQIVVSEACFGARGIFARRLIEGGVYAFVGSTHIAFGASDPNEPTMADEIARDFFLLVEQGYSPATALARAKHMLLAHHCDSNTNPILLWRTLTSFVVLGHPVSCIRESAPGAHESLDVSLRLVQTAGWRYAPLEEAAQLSVQVRNYGIYVRHAAWRVVERLRSEATAVHHDLPERGREPQSSYEPESETFQWREGSGEFRFSTVIDGWYINISGMMNVPDSWRTTVGRSVPAF